METPRRPEGSIDQIFNWVLLGSFILHLGIGLLVMNIEPPPPPAQEEYASWLKRVTPPKVIEEAPPPKEEEKPKVEKVVPKEEVVEERVERVERVERARPSRAAKAATPGEASKRAAVRQQLSGAGVLASIGAASEEGELANVFESEAVVGKELGKVLAERGGVRVTGGTRIGKKGALGPGVTGEVGVETGAGGAVGGIAGRAGAVPKGFVKSTEAVLKKGGIDERGVQLALKRRERGIQQCYERALKSNPKLKGRVGFEWGINEQGRVVAIKVVENSLPDPKVVDCITDIIQRIRFPEAAKGIVPVRKTFVFEAGG